MTTRQLHARRAVTSVEQHGLLGTTPVELGPDHRSMTTALRSIAYRHVRGSSAYRGVPSATQREPGSAMPSEGRSSCGRPGAMHVGSAIDFAKPSDARRASSSFGDIAAGAIGLQRPTALRSNAREQARVSYAELRETGDPS